MKEQRLFSTENALIMLGLLALASLMGCASLNPLRPFQDHQAEEWCTDVTRGQAYYSEMTGDLDVMALDGGWGLQYALAKGAIELLGRKLLGDCALIKDGYSVEKEEIAWAVAEGAGALGDLVQIHQAVTAPRPDPNQPLGFLSRSAAVMGSRIPHASLLQELRLVQAEATAVAARNQ